MNKKVMRTEHVLVAISCAVVLGVYGIMYGIVFLVGYALPFMVDFLFRR